MQLNDIIIERLKKRLEAVGKSASAVSLEAGLGRSAIQSILSGASDSPRVATLWRLTKPLDCSIAYLLGTTDDPQRFSDPSMVSQINQFPPDSLAVAKTVSVIHGGGFEKGEYYDDTIPPDDRLLVRDSNYPEVPVSLFLTRIDQYWEDGIAKGDILSALTDVEAHSVAIENDAFVVVRYKRHSDKASYLSLERLRIEPSHVQIGDRIFRRQDHLDDFQYVVYPGSRLIVAKRKEWALSGNESVEIAGVVIRGLRRWKRATVY